MSRGAGAGQECGSEAMLTADGLDVYYGKVRALDGVSLKVNDGEIVGVVGSNGAGKSTLVGTIMGLQAPSAGEIRFGGMKITGWPTHKIHGSGLVLVPERRGIFGDQTVLDNLRLGAFSRSYSAQRHGIRQDLSAVMDRFPRLRERAHQLAGTLSGGEQQMLAIARALMARPRTLLLDEPTLGLDPINIETILQSIRQLNKEGVTILLVDETANRVLPLVHRCYVLERGRVVLEAGGKEMLRNPIVRQFYFGLQEDRSSHAGQH